METYSISKRERQSFYEFIEDAYKKLNLQILKNEREISSLRIELNYLKSLLDINYFNPILPSTLSSFVSFLNRTHFRQIRQETRARTVERIIYERIYFPLALTVCSASTILGLISILLKQYLISIPLISVSLFSLYYYYNTKSALR